MSATVFGVPPSAPPAADPDTVDIQVGSNRFRGWQSVSITRSCETIPNSFALSASTQFMPGPVLAGTRPGQPCTIFVGSDTVITGWLDRRIIQADGHNHLVTISGRGITRNLVDCSADLVNDPGLVGGMINATSTLDLATRLSKAFGITVRSAVSDLGPPIPAFQVMLGETPYNIIESVARYAGYLVYEDETGALVLDRIGTQSMASGFRMPGNIEAISAERSVDQRFSDYTVVWYGTNQVAELGALANQRATVSDPTLGEYRPRIIVSEQIAPPIVSGQPFDPNAVAKQRANWEYARRLGRSQAASITCDSWRDIAGKLWTPNWLAPIEAPKSDITGAQWIIGTVTFRKDPSGTHADLILMPPLAFTPEPNPLNLFDNEITTTLSGSGGAATPATSPQSGASGP